MAKPWSEIRFKHAALEVTCPPDKIMNHDNPGNYRCRRCHKFFANPMAAARVSCARYSYEVTARAESQPAA